MTQFRIFFSELRDTTFVDWGSVDGGSVDFQSFVDTWYGMTDDTALWMEAPWIVTYLQVDSNKINTASTNVTPFWDWSEAGEHKSGPTQNFFIDDRGTGSVEDFRFRLRGKGRAIKLHYNSDSQTPMNLLGWSILLDRNANY